MLAELLLVWAGLLGALVAFAIGRPGEGGALTLAYFLGLSLIHVPGVLPFLDPGIDLGDRELTEIGFELTILGMATFVPGAVLARWIGRRVAVVTSASRRQRALAFQRLGRRVLVLGAVAYFVLVPISFRVPSLTSVVSPFGTLLILGFWLALYGANLAADRYRTLATLALLPLLPLATLVSSGFLGYGIYWALTVVTFLFVIIRRRTWFYLSAPMAVFLGISLFVTYMGQRAAIRELTWQEHAGLLDRLDRVSAIVTEFQLFDLGSPTQAATLDGRLNQNWLVGAAIRYHEDGSAPFAYGATIPVWALIPRAAWPDKPQIAGSGDIVSDFTGIHFAEGTSVGVGQVLEFYINFGIPGLVIGFFGLGYLLMWLDRGIMGSLAADNLHKVLLQGMPGLMLLQPGGSLLEIFVGCVAACISARLIISLRFFDIPLAQSRRGAA